MSDILNRCNNCGTFKCDVVSCFFYQERETKMAYIEEMRGMEYIKTTRRYLNYLEEHLKNVQFAFTEVSDACDGMAWVGDDMAWHSLRSEVIYHDLSKFTADEFTQYRDSFFPVCEEDKKGSGFEDAWEHHKQQNHHHHETAENYLDIVHMVIDWAAMGYKFNDTPREYYEKNKDKITLSIEHRVFMLELFDRLEKFREKV